MGAANRNFSGMSESTAAFCEKGYDVAISTMMHSPIQNADMLPATKPERMFSEAPPCLEQLVTSRTWRELVLTNTFVNSGINAPAIVPQLMITDSAHQRSGSGTLWICFTPCTNSSLGTLKSPSNSLLATNVMPMDTAEVIQTRCVNGASKSKSFLPANLALLMPSFRK